MSFHACSSSGEVDDSKFAEPLPWIGVYIAAASLLCSLLMGIDTFLGFHRRKLWFPCSWFSLNAASLTLLSVATKLPLDLNTSMPRPQDQLTKLSGTVLVCTVMGNFMISLGSMKESEMISNLIALTILVVTVIGNIAIQMSTGVIYVFLPEHALIMFFMLLLLLILCSTALTAPAAKMKLRSISPGYGFNAQSAVDVSDIEKMKDVLRRGWTAVHTSNPDQYLVGRFSACTASGALCLLSALILVQAAVRSFTITRSSSLHFCQGQSDYKWSMTLVLISQLIAIWVGTIAPVIRWFNAVRYRSPSMRESCKGDFKVLKYGFQRLDKWKEKPLPSLIGNRRFRKVVHISRNLFVDVIIQVQRAVGLVSTLIKLASILIVSCLSGLISSSSSSWTRCKRRGRGGGDQEIGSELQPESRPRGINDQDLRHYVVVLKEERALIQLIATDCREDVDHLIRRGSKRPNYLLRLSSDESQSSRRQSYLLRLSDKFLQSIRKGGEVEFDSDQVELLGTESPLLYCWALPVVTLTSIAITIAFATPSSPSVGKGRVEALQRGVHDNLKYLRLTDDQRSDLNHVIKAREAANIVWLHLDIYDRWLGNDLKKLARTEKTPEKILEQLADLGKKHVLDHIKDENQRHPSCWSPQVLAADSMYRVCRTISLKQLGTADQIFEWLEKTIVDILGACVTKLPQMIRRKCRHVRGVDKREEDMNIRELAYLLGEAEHFLTQVLSEIGEFPMYEEDDVGSSASVNHDESPELQFSLNGEEYFAY